MSKSNYFVFSRITVIEDPVHEIIEAGLPNHMINHLNWTRSTLFKIRTSMLGKIGKNGLYVFVKESVCTNNNVDFFLPLNHVNSFSFAEIKLSFLRKFPKASVLT